LRSTSILTYSEISPTSDKSDLSGYNISGFPIDALPVTAYVGAHSSKPAFDKDAGVKKYEMFTIGGFYEDEGNEEDRVGIQFYYF
jgi:hypothetical protein